MLTACAPLCIACDTNGPDKCDATKCNSTSVYNSDTQKCDGKEALHTQSIYAGVPRVYCLLVHFVFVLCSFSCSCHCSSSCLSSLLYSFSSVWSSFCLYSSYSLSSRFFYFVQLMYIYCLTYQHIAFEQCIYQCKTLLSRNGN